MSIRDEIDALPPLVQNWESVDARLELAERLLREWLSAAPMDSEPRASTRAYLAKREAE